MDLPPPPQGGVPFDRTDNEGAPSSGIGFVNAVEDRANDEVDKERSGYLEVVPPAIVNDNNHPNIAPSYDEEIALV